MLNITSHLGVAESAGQSWARLAVGVSSRFPMKVVRIFVLFSVDYPGAESEVEQLDLK